MGYNRYYSFDNKKDNGYNPCDILLKLYDSDDFKTIAIRQEDLVPWKICEALNNAYKAGREDAMRDLRIFIGVDK